jgi:uncharacterized damage-inducible protein DinB
MTPEVAKAMADGQLAVIEMETQLSLKVLKAIPEDKKNYRPHPDSRTAIELARHLPVSDMWFLDAVTNGEFGMPDAAAEEAVETIAQAIAIYEEKFPPALAKVRAMSGDDLAKAVPMFGFLNEPAVNYLGFLIRHAVHHRGQLSVYLRPMGAKVPSIYGGSADEPMQMPEG